MRTLSISLLALVLPSLALAKYPYEGKFQRIKAGKGCENILAKKELDMTLFFIGPTKTKAVLYMTDPDVQESLFNETNLYGLYDRFTQRLVADTTVSDKTTKYAIKYDGHADIKFLFADMTVKKIDVKTNKELCEAKAEYAAFPPK